MQPRLPEKSVCRIGEGHSPVPYTVPGSTTVRPAWPAARSTSAQAGYRDGLVRAIGVSNFHPHHLDTLLQHCQIRPVVNQIELHPYLPQKGNLLHCAARDVLVEAWAPIAKGRVLAEPVILRLAQKYGKTPAQIVLRWELQHGIIIIPKSVHKERIRENSQIFDFSLTDDELTDINGLARNGRIGVDPDLMEY